MVPGGGSTSADIRIPLPDQWIGGKVQRHAQMNAPQICAGKQKRLACLDPLFALCDEGSTPTFHRLFSVWFAVWETSQGGVGFSQGGMGGCPGRRGHPFPHLCGIPEGILEAGRQAQACQKARYDTQVQLLVFIPGQKVLLLLPSSVHKLQMKWQGPFEVVAKWEEVNFEVQIPRQGNKLTNKQTNKIVSGEPP